MQRTQNWITASDEYQLRGEKGLNEGIPYRISSLNTYVSGTQRGRYVLYFAGPGVGKSKIVYDQHIFVPYDYALEHPEVDLHIHLWSLEINPIFVIGAAKVYWLYTRKRVLTDVNTIYSIGNNKLTPFIKELIDSDECKSYIDGLMKCLHIEVDGTRHTINNKIKTFAKNRGTFIVNNGELTEYIPNNPHEIVVIIIDHMSLINTINGESLKLTIDAVSRNFTIYRDKMKYAPIAIQQINPEKYKNDVDKILPKHEDLRDSKNTFQDCDVAISIGSPYTKQVNEFIGYKIIPQSSLDSHTLGDRFRVIQVVKNRYGSVSVVIPTLFIGEVGYYTNIQSPEDIDYEQISNIHKLKK